ncbi:MAG: hypothetical protein WA277_12435 [Nitrospirota bacterium]
MKKLGMVVAMLFILLSTVVIDNVAGQGEISIPITIDQKMSRGPENAPVTIYEFSSYQ